ncbi:hypothetical protein COF64_22730 [Bacillus sp. AFS043905]|nr:hypothetical protein COF64_22730 [Bacillus sp. AFS043905]
MAQFNILSHFFYPFTIASSTNASVSLSTNLHILDKSIRVGWEMAEEEKFNKVVRHGTEVAMSELAHSVHAEVYGLKPGWEYYY